MKREIKVGVFFAAACFILAAIIFMVGDLSVLFKRPGYELFTYFETAAGLEKHTVVKMAGVKVGYVKEIRLKGVRAELIFNIDHGVAIYKDSQAMVASLGLLGEKYIEIVPGEGPEFCSPGDTIGSIPPVGIAEMGPMVLSIGREITEVAKTLREVIGGEEPKTNVRHILQNLSAFTHELREFSESNKDRLTESFQASSEVIRKFDQRVEAVANNLDAVILSLQDMIDENKISIQESMEKISVLIEKTQDAVKLLNESLERINRGEGTVGKLIQEPELYDKAHKALSDVESLTGRASSLRLSGGVRLDYYGSSEMIKGYLSLGLWLAPDKYFLGQIIHDPWLDKFTYSTQGGLRLGPVLPRGGIMESELGIGVDYHAFNDRLRFSLESFDFNREPRPHFRIYSRFFAANTIYLLFGWDDFAVSSRRELFFGMGVGL